MRFFKIIGLFFTLWSSSVYAASFEYMQRECRQRMADNPPQIIVEYSFGKLNFDTSKSSEELVTLAQQFNPQTKTEGNMQGLTGLKFATTMNVETLTEEIGNNDVCVVPQTVRLRIYYVNPTIYLVNSLKPQTCRYNLVLRHEQTHLDIGHTSFLELTQRLKQRLIDIVNERGPKIVLKKLYVQDSQAIIQKLMEEYENDLKPLINSYKKKLLEEQMQLDTAENYQRETALCP